MLEVRRAATARDIDACLRIRAQVFIHEQKVPADIERDAYDDQAWHFIALEDGLAVGTARVVLKDESTAKIGRVAVSAAWRGRGIGQALMIGIEQAPELKDVRQFALDAQSRALEFYRRLGFEACGDEFMEAGIAHRHMRKERMRS